MRFRRVVARRSRPTAINPCKCGLTHALSPCQNASGWYTTWNARAWSYSRKEKIWRERNERKFNEKIPFSVKRDGRFRFLRQLHGCPLTSLTTRRLKATWHFVGLTEWTKYYYRLSVSRSYITHVIYVLSMYAQHIT